MEQIQTQPEAEAIDFKNEDKKKRNDSKWIIGIIIGVAITVLIIIKQQSSNFPFKTLLILIGVTIIIGLIGLFFFNIKKFFKGILGQSKEEEPVGVPKAINELELREIAKKVIESDVYQNHIKNWGKTVPYSKGRNEIYELQCELLYPEDDSHKCSIIINSNYADKIPGVLFNPKIGEVSRVVNAMSMTPEEEPTVEERIEKDLNLGKEVVYKRKAPHPTKHKKPKEEFI